MTRRCKHGHELTDDNTFRRQWVTAQGEIKDYRVCKTCTRDAARLRMRQRRANAAKAA